MHGYQAISTFLVILVFSIQALPQSAHASGQCIDVTARWRWGALPPNSISYQSLPIPYVIIHHTVTGSCTNLTQCARLVANIQSHHMGTNGWEDIGYNFLIGGDGVPYAGRGWTVVGTHTVGWNNQSIGIGFIGDFSDSGVSDAMLANTHQLIQYGKAIGILAPDVRVVGAHQLVSTTSPGAALYAQIQTWPEWVAQP